MSLLKRVEQKLPELSPFLYGYIKEEVNLFIKDFYHKNINSNKNYKLIYKYQFELGEMHYFEYYLGNKIYSIYLPIFYENVEFEQFQVLVSLGKVESIFEEELLFEDDFFRNHKNTVKNKTFNYCFNLKMNTLNLIDICEEGLSLFKINTLGNGKAKILYLELKGLNNKNILYTISVKFPIEEKDIIFDKQYIKDNLHSIQVKGNKEVYYSWGKYLKDQKHDLTVIFANGFEKYYPKIKHIYPDRKTEYREYPNKLDSFIKENDISIKNPIKFFRKNKKIRELFELYSGE